MAERSPLLLELARAVDKLLQAAEGPALASLRSGLRQELQRWVVRADRDPSAARVRDVIAALLTMLEPDTSGPCRARGRRTP